MDIPALKMEPNLKEIILEGITTMPKDNISESLIKQHRYLGYLRQAVQIKIIFTISEVKFLNPSKKIIYEGYILNKSKKINFKGINDQGLIYI